MIKFLIIPVNTLLGIYICWITAPLILSATDEILGRYMSDVLGFAYAGLLVVAIIFLTRNILKKRKSVAANIEKSEPRNNPEEPRAKDQAF